LEGGNGSGLTEVSCHLCVQKRKNHFDDVKIFDTLEKKDGGVRGGSGAHTGLGGSQRWTRNCVKKKTKNVCILGAVGGKIRINVTREKGGWCF